MYKNTVDKNQIVYILTAVNVKQSCIMMQFSNKKMGLKQMRII